MRSLIRSAGRPMAVVLMLLLIHGCFTPKNVRTLGSAVAIKGKDVSSTALSAYSELAKQPDIDKAQQDFVKVVTSPNPTSANLPNTESKPFTKQLQPRIAAYKALLNTYSTFQILTDKDYGAQATTASSSLLSSFNALKSVPDLPDSVTTALPSLTGIITEAQRAKDIRKHNRALTQLSKAYGLLWQDDLPVWQDYLNRIYQDYAQGLSTLDAQRFNETSLAAFLKEPFSKDINVGLYKIQRRNAAYAERDAILDKLRRVNQAFTQLESAHAELAKAQPNLIDALAALDSIDGILNSGQ